MTLKSILHLTTVSFYFLFHNSEFSRLNYNITNSFLGGKSYDLEGNVSDVHKQAGLSFTSPVFPDQQLTEDVLAKVYLLRKSDKVKSAPEDFVFRPNRLIKTAPKRTKQQTRAVTQNQEGNDDSSKFSLYFCCAYNVMTFKNSMLRSSNTVEFLMLRTICSIFTSKVKQI